MFCVVQWQKLSQAGSPEVAFYLTLKKNNPSLSLPSLAHGPIASSVTEWVAVLLARLNALFKFYSEHHHSSSLGVCALTSFIPCLQHLKMGCGNTFFSHDKMIYKDCTVHHDLSTLFQYQLPLIFTGHIKLWESSNPTAPLLRSWTPSVQRLLSH